MTGIAKKILIYATIDGLVIQPLAQKQRPSSSVKILYSDGSILPTVKDDDVVSPKFEAFGIIGEHVMWRSYISCMTDIAQAS